MHKLRMVRAFEFGDDSLAKVVNLRPPRQGSAVTTDSLLDHRPKSILGAAVSNQVVTLPFLDFLLSTDPPRVRIQTPRKILTPPPPPRPL